MICDEKCEGCEQCTWKGMSVKKAMIGTIECFGPMRTCEIIDLLIIGRIGYTQKQLQLSAHSTLRKAPEFVRVSRGVYDLA